MAGFQTPTTSVTLLDRLRQDPTDQAAWTIFVNRYGPILIRWCRHWGLQSADADDVTQDVLVRLARKLREFQYDATGSFRGWLATLTRHAWADALERREPALTGPVAEGAIRSAEAQADLAARMAEAFDHEVLDEAFRRVRSRVPPHYWEVFRRTALEHRTGAEIAAEMGIKVTTIYVIRSKVQSHIREAILELGEVPSEDFS
jgi:RNA polymerase sigma-70 factor (ECF subfamily)